MSEQVTMFKDRRRFFRINDTIGVSYHLLSDAEKSVIEKEVSVDSALLQSVDRLNAQLLRIIDNVQAAQPDVALALNLMNQKIDMLYEKHEIGGQLVAEINFDKREVSLSANGLAFSTAEHFAEEDLLRIDILLDKANLQVTAIGRVVVCESLDKPRTKAKPFYTRVHFIQIKSHDQEILAQYVINKQNEFFDDKKKTGKPH
jgi:c-di-GMP-binding flagellar brake protein YcgR